MLHMSCKLLGYYWMVQIMHDPDWPVNLYLMLSSADQSACDAREAAYVRCGHGGRA